MDVILMILLYVIFSLLELSVLVFPKRRRRKKSKDQSKDCEHPCRSGILIKPIAYLESCFPRKNGTPRQGCLAPSTFGRFKLVDCFTGTNDAKQALVGLEEYSHLWIIFYFHENRQMKKLRPKVRPPRLKWKNKTGIMSTRSPHRPNKIGLTLVKIESLSVKTGYVTVSGVDMIDGTPILDIKPFIPFYDYPKTEIKLSRWVEQPQSVIKNVEFSDESLNVMRSSVDQIKFYDDLESLKAAVVQMCLLDPRSVFRKTKMDLSADYYIHFDKMNMLCRMVNEDTLKIEKVAITYEDVKLDG